MAVEDNERAVLAGLTRALLEGGARSVPLSAIFEGCGRRIPAPVILEVLDRLVAAGLVRQQAAAAGVVQLVPGGGVAPARAASGAEDSYAISESGFNQHAEALQAELDALASALPGRLATEGIGPAERAAWADLHDYLSWRQERSVHLANFALARRMTPEALRRFQEAMLRLGLIERAQAETHWRLTELGLRLPRLPQSDRAHSDRAQSERAQSWKG